MFAMKFIDPQEYQSLSHNEEIKDLETCYTLLGATGVEDLLQDNVQSCI